MTNRGLAVSILKATSSRFLSQCLATGMTRSSLTRPDPSLPQGTKLLGDLGYLGATSVSVPYKSSKLKPLTKRQVTYNQKHAQRRIVVEHVFANLKKWRILAYRVRNPIPTYNHIFSTVCALRNFATA